jgi:hypothetical protein
MADQLRSLGVAPRPAQTAAIYPFPAGSPPPAQQEWTKRPAFHPEEGEADRSDWVTLVKSMALILGVVAVIAFLLSL